MLNYLANSDKEVVPVVITLADLEFKKYKNGQCLTDLTGFYTWDGGYKMNLCIYPNGRYDDDNYISVGVYLMKGDHDDHLAWPVQGTLTVQLLNQLSDSNHSEPVEFCYDGLDKACQRVKTRGRRSHSIWCDQLMPHKRLSYDADKKCQYLKDDCVFFRVCNFQ